MRNFREIIVLIGFIVIASLIGCGGGGGGGGYVAPAGESLSGSVVLPDDTAETMTKNLRTSVSYSGLKVHLYDTSDNDVVTPVDLGSTGIFSFPAVPAGNNYQIVVKNPSSKILLRKHIDSFSEAKSSVTVNSESTVFAILVKQSNFTKSEANLIEFVSAANISSLSTKVTDWLKGVFSSSENDVFVVIIAVVGETEIDKIIATVPDTNTPVVAAPTLSAALPPGGSYWNGSSTKLSLSIPAGSDAVSKVEFFVGGSTKIAEFVAAPYEYTVQNISGQMTFTAIVMYASGVSKTVTKTVTCKSIIEKVTVVLADGSVGTLVPDSLTPSVDTVPCDVATFVITLAAEIDSKPSTFSLTARCLDSGGTVTLNAENNYLKMTLSGKTLTVSVSSSGNTRSTLRPGLFYQVQLNSGEFSIGGTKIKPDILSAQFYSMRTVNAPIGVACKIGGERNFISWQPLAGADSYNLYFATSPGGTRLNGQKIANVTSPFDHKQLSAGTTYYYVVTANTTSGESAESSEVSATPEINPPPQLIMYPNENTLITEGLTINCSFKTSDDGSVVRLEVFKNSERVLDISSPSSEEIYQLVTPSIGNYNFTVKATDDFGKTVTLEKTIMVAKGSGNIEFSSPTLVARFWGSTAVLKFIAPPGKNFPNELRQATILPALIFHPEIFDVRYIQSIPLGFGTTNSDYTEISFSARPRTSMGNQYDIQPITSLNSSLNFPLGTTFSLTREGFSSDDSTLLLGEGIIE